MLREELWRDAGALGGFPLYLLVFLLAVIYDTSLAIQLFIGGLLSLFLTTLIRIVYFKDRPVKETYNNFIRKIHASTFPSLHTMRASLMATILTAWMPNVILGIVLFLSAAGVGYSRVKFKRHFVKDVVSGYVIGIIVA